MNFYAFFLLLFSDCKMSGRAGKVRKKRISRSAKAGVVFPVSRYVRCSSLEILKKLIKKFKFKIIFFYYNRESTVKIQYMETV